MVEKGALPGHQHGYTGYANNSADGQARLQELHAAGLVAPVAQAPPPILWALTHAGLQQQQLCWKLERPCQVCAIRDGPLSEMT
eukprot:10692578-Lingulodinium_polyedra.AAC.1